MRIQYFYDAGRMADPREDLGFRKKLKAAGVDTLWLPAYFSGHPQASEAALCRAADLLRAEGFTVGSLMLPVGHPGNSLNPEDPSLDLSLAPGWRYRTDDQGRPVYHCADVEPQMIADNRRLVRRLAELNLGPIMHDDDIRMGNAGPQMEGCFCEGCIAAFNAHTGRHETRESLRIGLSQRKDIALTTDWAADLCRKLTSLVSAMDVPGMPSGLMVMHSGDERHGIDLPALGKAYPNMHFRVGEGHFFDEEYASPQHRASIWCSVMQHLSLMEGHETYTETTVFPPRALKPRYLLGKARLGLAAGVDHIFYMSGTWRMSLDYWEVLARGLDGLKCLAQTLHGEPRRYPVHVANGTHGGLVERIQPPLLPFMAGIPCRPVRAADPSAPADILLFFGDYRITPQWEEKFNQYQSVVLDETACRANASYLARHGSDFIRAPFAVDDTLAQASALQHLIRQIASDPMPIVSGAACTVVWLAKGDIMPFSLENDPACVEITAPGEHPRSMVLMPSGMEDGA